MEQVKTKKVGISATISPELYQKLKIESEHERRSMAQLIEIILEENLKDKKSKGAK